MANKNSGFTLIEMMIAVAIVGILASIAYPSYQSYVERSRRGDAIISLLELAQAQERFMARCGHYASKLDGTPACGDANEGLGGDAQSREGFYQLSLAASGAASYTLKATPKGAQTSDIKCAELTLDHLGQRGAKGDGGANNESICW
ncbi:type IV pilin protein [Halomonas sp. PR-M31]|uniref:type IV pilin protein n=1 Tax=Halomonas sp. PR-M31 TaxID=1471202 RepID=UPI00065012CA|nr:type IV pilin protein [Halomonas sp. PR-M31]